MMSQTRKKLASRDAHSIITTLFTQESRINGLPYDIIEQRHVLLGNAIFFRLRLRTKDERELCLDLGPIETNEKDMSKTGVFDIISTTQLPLVEDPLTSP